MKQLPISKSLTALHQCVPGSRIEYQDELPYCTVDGKRQVVSLENHPGYDLWALKRKPFVSKTLIDDMDCHGIGASLENAVTFLEGIPLKELRKARRETPEQAQWRSNFNFMGSVLVDIARQDKRNST